jgi:hypothetical protein
MRIGPLKLKAQLYCGDVPAMGRCCLLYAIRVHRELTARRLRRPKRELRVYWPICVVNCWRNAFTQGVFVGSGFPSPEGGQRGLGIPNVRTRMVQQAVLQILEPIFDPTFHPSSHGFRHNRGAHTAIAEATG